MLRSGIGEYKSYDWPDWFCPAKPLPDELAHSYQHRVAVLNGDTGIQQVIGRLRRDGFRDRRLRHRVEFLALVANMPVPDFVQHHTMTPLNKAFSTIGECYVHGTGDDHRSLMNAMDLSRASRERYCEKCVEEDLHILRFPYWRRSHQISGVGWCLKHDCVLTQGSGNVMDGFTREFKPHKGRHAMDLHSVRNSPVVARYVELALAVLERRRPIVFGTAGRVLRQYARSRGIIDSSSVRGTLLSTLAAQKCPSAWLKSTFPKWSCYEAGQYMNPLDGVWEIGRTRVYTAYLLAAALIFTDVTEALREISVDDSDDRHLPPRRVRYPNSNYGGGRRVRQGRMNHRLILT